MSSSTSLLLATRLAIAPAAPSEADRLDLDAEGLDPAAVELGLRARVGDELDDWTIEVERTSATTYRVMLRRDGSRRDRRVVTLTGPTDEDRSRELAATLALILDESADDRAQDSDRLDRLEGPTGFLVVEADVQLGPPDELDPSLGLGLGGGAWLLDDHLQPRVRVGWSHSWAGALEVHQVDAGLGLAAGAAVGRGAFWLGALILPSLKWTYAHEVSSSSSWFGGGELSAVVQWRPPTERRVGWVVGLRTGVETTFPAPRVPGTRDVIRWGHARWLAVLELGFGL